MQLLCRSIQEKKWGVLGLLLYNTGLLNLLHSKTKFE